MTVQAPLPPQALQPLNQQVTFQQSALSELPHLWAVFKRRFRLFMATALAVMALVIIITFQLTPTYTGEARVILNAQETRALDASEILAGVSPDAAVVDTEVELITSRSMAEKVADGLNLYAVPEFNPTLNTDSGPFDWLIPSQFRAAEADADRNGEMVKAQVVRNVADAISAERLGITYAILIETRSQDPELAGQMANMVAERYVLDSLEQKFDTYTLVTNRLDQAVAEFRERLRQAENAAETYRAENGLLSAEGTLLSEQQVSDLQAQLIIQEADLAEARAKLNAVNRRMALGDPVDAITDVLASPVIAELRTQEADLARRRAELETRYGERHPLMDNVRSEEADLQLQIQSEVSRIVAGLQNEVDVAAQRVAALEGSIDELRTDLAQDNQALVRLRELERDAEVSQRNYEELLERSREARIFEDLAEADARIADRATTPLSPSFPNKFLNLILSCFLGAALGGVMIVLAEIFDTGLRTADDVERMFGRRLLSMVPTLEKDKLTEDIPTPQDYLADKPLSVFAESYRNVRSELATQVPRTDEGAVLAFTSAVSGEGKTSSVISFGRVAALAGDKVLLIEGDARRRSLSIFFGNENTSQTDLSDLIKEDLPIAEGITEDKNTGLHAITLGPRPALDKDLYGSPRFAALLKKLRQQYELIVIDTPPLTAVADARTLVGLSDSVVHCVRWQKTPAGVAKSARSILSGMNAPLAGVILTQVDMRAQSGYSYEGSSHYYAQHGKYYVE